MSGDMRVTGDAGVDAFQEASRPLAELNNNDTNSAAVSKVASSESDLKRLLCTALIRQDSASGMSVSSVSSSNSDTSEGLADKDEEGLLQEGGSTTLTRVEILKKEFRSMSERQANQIEKQDAFPSLPDSVLEKLGLLGESIKERFDADEIEQKFVALALAFAIDSTTIKDRCERQKRFRDQTEKNLLTEMGRLNEKIVVFQTLAMDASTIDLLAGLLAQIDTILRAFSHALVSTERYGAVQHEQKLTDAVSLMVNHVTYLKQQRDAARKQVEYTKNVLQVTTNSPDPSSGKTKQPSPNGKNGIGRRASIATVSQSQDGHRSSLVTIGEVRKITRRTSDLTSRVSTFARLSRPSRFELNVDLDQIKEAAVTGHKSRTRLQDTPESTEQSDDEPETKNQSELSLPDIILEEPSPDVDTSTFTFRQKLKYKIDTFTARVQTSYEKRTADRSLNDFFYFASLLCFTFGVVIMINLYIELEFSRVYIEAEKSSSWDVLVRMMMLKNG